MRGVLLPSLFCYSCQFIPPLSLNKQQQQLQEQQKQQQQQVQSVIVTYENVSLSPHLYLWQILFILLSFAFHQCIQNCHFFKSDSQVT